MNADLERSLAALRGMASILRSCRDEIDARAAEMLAGGLELLAAEIGVAVAPSA
jgi:hypothetical protein